MPLPPSSVLCTVGTPCTMSAVGSTETHRALVSQNPDAIGFAAFDAGLVDIERGSGPEPRFVGRDAPHAGEPLTAERIEQLWGDRLRASMGIRRLSRDRLAQHVPTDVAAPLPHDLEDGGLRRLSGLTFAEIRQSPLMDLFGLFDDDPRLGPSLQSQLFLYGGLGALSALPKPLSELVPDPRAFRVAAACAFTGHESFEHLRLGM